MTRNNHKPYITTRAFRLPAAILLGAATTIPALSQQRLDESISVDGRYDARVVRMERLTSLPSPVRFTLDTRPLDYESTGVTADFAPRLLTLPPSLWRVSDRDWRGRVKASVGSWLDASLDGVFHILTPSAEHRDALTLRLRHESTSLWSAPVSTLPPFASRPETGAGTPEADPSRRYLYDEGLAIDYAHMFGNGMTFSVGGALRGRWFNYYATLPGAFGTEEKAPSQNLLQYQIYLGVEGARRPGKLEWGARLDIGGNSRDHLYLPVPYGGLERFSGTTQRDITLSVPLGLDLDNEPGRRSAVGLDLELRHVGTVASKDASLLALGTTVSPSAGADGSRSNHTQLLLNPSYTRVGNALDWRIGAKVYVSGSTGVRAAYAESTGLDASSGHWHIAPDLHIGWHDRHVSLYADATGSLTPRTTGTDMEMLGNAAPYAMPWQLTSMPLWTPAELRAGIRLRPLSGLEIGVRYSYAWQRDIPLQGWYQTMLDMGAGISGWPGVTDGATLGRVLLRNDIGVNLHGSEVAFEARYEPSARWRVEADVTWTPQDGHVGRIIGRGLDRPEWTAGISLSAHPWGAYSEQGAASANIMSRIGLHAAFEWRGNRSVSTWMPAGGDAATATPPGNLDIISPDGQVAGGDYRLGAVRLGDMADLSLGAEWSLTSRLRLTLDAVNILNRHTPVMPLLPAAGISIRAGIDWQF